MGGRGWIAKKYRSLYCELFTCPTKTRVLLSSSLNALNAFASKRIWYSVHQEIYAERCSQDWGSLQEFPGGPSVPVQCRCLYIPQEAQEAPLGSKYNNANEDMVKGWLQLYTLKTLVCLLLSPLHGFLPHRVDS